MLHVAGYILLGLTAGIISGLVGIGGGIIIVPALIFLFGLSQHQAQGTTLALLVPPIGLLAAWAYYRCGYVNLAIAAFVCLGFAIGGLLGAHIATKLPELALRRIFGSVLLLTALYMLLTTPHNMRVK